MIRGQKVLALIVARGGSKGLPRKNILKIKSKPLINWTIDEAKKSNYIDRLILSSDDDEIIDIAVKNGCEAPFKRSPELATDLSSTEAVVMDALQKVPGYQLLVLLQPTSPLRVVKDIDEAIELLAKNNASTCVSVTPSAEHPYLAFNMNEEYKLSSFIKQIPDGARRRQDFPPSWRINGAIYVVKIDQFLQSQKFIDENTVGYEMPITRSLDIDTFEDILKLEAILQATSTERSL